MKPLQTADSVGTCNQSSFPDYHSTNDNVHVIEAWLSQGPSLHFYSYTLFYTVKSCVSQDIYDVCDWFLVDECSPSQ